MIDKPYYVTRVQFAVPLELLSDFHHLFKKQPAFEPLQADVISGDTLLQAVDAAHPDVLVVDMTLPHLDTDKVLGRLSSTRIPRYVLATAPRHRPHLTGLQQYRSVKGVLPRRLALSPLIRHVISGIAEGSEYFVAAPPSEYALLGLTKDDTILLGLMGVGLEAGEIAQELGRSIHTIYTWQCQLRKRMDVQTNEQAILAAIRFGLVGVFTDSADRVVRSRRLAQ